MSNEKVRLILVSVPTAENASQIARLLVEERLAACVSRLPGASAVYRWQGKIEESQEHVLLIKTASDRLSQLMERIVQLHHDEVPEILALPVENGYSRYLEWVIAETRGVVY